MLKEIIRLQTIKPGMVVRFEDGEMLGIVRKLSAGCRAKVFWLNGFGQHHGTESSVDVARLVSMEGLVTL